MNCHFDEMLPHQKYATTGSYNRNKQSPYEKLTFCSEKEVELVAAGKVVHCLVLSLSMYVFNPFL